jgi:hypothetical protein
MPREEKLVIRFDSALDNLPGTGYVCILVRPPAAKKD